MLQRAHSRFRQGVLDALDGSGLNPGHLAIVGALVTTRESSPRDLIAATGIEKSSMVLMLDFLESEGWIERAEHPSDRRTYVVRLTKSGKTRTAALGPKLDGVETAFLKALSAGERRAFIDLLKRLQ